MLFKDKYSYNTFTQSNALVYIFYGVPQDSINVQLLSDHGT